MMKKTDDSLPPGTSLDHYIIEYTLSHGGFSIVYLARVTGFEKRVAIKEYMPRKLARRADDLSIVPAREEDTERFIHGRKLFFNEASILATLKHPNIVNVFNFFSANGTVYLVMEYQTGKNLQHYISRHGGGLSEKFIRTVFPPILRGLRVIHNFRLMHLDIKPANIHLRPGGNPLLLDFGAVHRAMMSRRKQSSQVVTPGYSPIEQYDNQGYVGPWTDIYATGATMRTCIEGKPPPPAKDRNHHDTMRPAAELYRKKYSHQLLTTIDWAMELDPLHRPQSVDEMLDALTQNDSLTVPDPAPESSNDKHQ